MCQDDPKVAVAAPRGHAKSTAVTHSFVLANVCFKYKKHVLIVSDTEGQAVDFLRDIKAEFVENEELIATFNIGNIIKDRENEVVVQFKDGDSFRIIAKGSEQKVRGMKWRNTRPDLIVGDDLENDDIVMNEERRHKFMRWFYGALLPCGGENTHIRIVGTILHLDSLLENLMPDALKDDTITTELAQYSEDDDRIWKSIRFKAHNEDFSEILWPERFSAEHFQEIRQDYMERGFPEGYSQEYLNYPLDEATAYFKKKDFLPLDDTTQPEEFYVACDLAISQKKSRAYTVFAVASVTHKGKLRFRDIVRFRGDALEIIDELFRLQNIYSPQCFFIEQENIARTLGPILNKEMQERDVYLTVEPMQATQDKIKRARALQARMRAGMVEFDHDAEWFPSFQQELLTFPRGKYMDQVDSAAWIALGLDKIIDVPTRAEHDRDEYERERDESDDFHGFGVSSITGY
tara:strand:- start:7787 stop:9172 length:1386 start_codon:yes stop_codon:yes gene_type:complete